MDGFFAVPRAHFGAPDIPTADEVVRVTVFPTTSIEMQSEKPGDLISPDLLDRWVRITLHLYAGDYFWARTESTFLWLSYGEERSGCGPMKIKFGGSFNGRFSPVGQTDSNIAPSTS